MIRRRFLIGALLAVLFGIGWGVGLGRASGDLYSNLDTFIEVLHAVQTSYVDPVEAKPLIEGGMRGMLSGLDAHSEYLDERAYAGLKSSLDEQFDGVGVLVDLHEGYPVIVSPVEGSPAWEAGLMPGDVITKIDGKAVFGLELPAIGSRVRGEPGTTVRVTVARPGEDERELVITRRRIEQRSVPYAFVAAGTGYVRLATFGEHAADEVRAALDTLRAGGARSLVLDLRGNPGGLVEQAVAVVQQLVPEGSAIVSTRGRLASANHAWTAAKGSHANTAWPVAVLVDGGSASAAEIVAGALQDLDRALVVGQATFGKGSVQDVFPLRNHEGALKLTTAWYYTPSGRSLQRQHPAEVADDSEEDDGSPDSASADSAAPAPVAPASTFHTASGRAVRGGGGVEPDLAVQPDSLPPLARAVEARRVALRFAARPQAGSDAWTAFRAYAREQGVTGDDAEFERERTPLEHVLERETARRAQGSAAAARIALADDAVFRRAADVLARAKSAHDVFAFAVPAGARTAPAKKAR